MGNETLYRKALEDLNSIHNGDDTFERICHVLTPQILPEYNFLKPAGGDGRKDGGRDGIDYNKNARMACSINTEYKGKINEEIQKKGEEKCLFYFSNQVISEPEKIKLEKKYSDIVCLRIYSIENIVQEIEIFLSSKFSPELYDLLRLSFLVNGAKINRGDSKKKEIIIGVDGLYKKVFSIKRNMKIEDYPASENPLADFIFTELQFHRVETFNHIFLKGIGNIGKTTIMKLAYNSIIDSYKNDISKNFLFFPFPIFFDLKYFTSDLTSIPNAIDPIIFFLDGLDELSDEKKTVLKKELGRILQDFPNVKFVISGRDASFISEIINLFEKYYIELKMEKYFDEGDTKLIDLLNNYKGSPIYDLLPLPIFREFAQNRSGNKNISYKVFYEELIRSKILLDKAKYDAARNITTRTNNASRINIEYILKQLSLLCYSLFEKNEGTFSEKDLKQYLGEGDDNIFLIESSLLDYQDKNHIGFVSNYYYEYFVANYFSQQNMRKITKAFFIQNMKDIKVNTLNIFTILLSILDKKNYIYRKILKKLEQINCSFILLTDFETMNDNERFKYYQAIVEKRNTERKTVYYTRFTNSHDILATIPSLSDSLRQLLPVSFYSDAVLMHLKTIESFLENPEDEDCVLFSNAVILLGVYGRPFWNFEQQAILKRISIPIIHFFMKNKISEKIKGLLSEDVIFDWYETYNWTEKWNEFEWNSFIQNIQENESTIESVITSENEFLVKLKLFNIIQKNNVRSKLRNALLFYVLNLKNTDTKHLTSNSLSTSPMTLDDAYETPTLRLDQDLYIFNSHLEQEYIDIDTLITLFSLIVKNKLILQHSSEFEISGIYDILIKKLIKSIPEISDAQIPSFYEIFVYLTRPTVSKLNDINILNTFRDSVKILIIDRIQIDMIKTDFNFNPFLDLLLYPLLNISDRAKAEKLLVLFDTDSTHGIYVSLIWHLHTKRLENHILYDKGEQCYPLCFQERIKKEEVRQKLLQGIDAEEVIMLLQEKQLLLDKDLLLKKINTVFKYIDNNKNFNEDLDESAKFFYLEADRIKSGIQYENDSFVTVPPVFSNFVLKLLRSFAFSDEKKEVNRKGLYSYLNNCFDTDKNLYWLFFYYNYVNCYPQENVMKILTDNYDVYTNIYLSMKKYVLQQLKEKSAVDFDEGRNADWVAPFANCIHIIFGDKHQEWIDKKNALKLCSYPAPLLHTTGGAFSAGTFIWGKYNSIFQWLEEVFLVDKESLISESFNVITLLRGDISRAQILDFLIQNIKNAVVTEDEIIKLIINESRRNIISDLNTSLSHVLGRFWRQYNDNHVEEMLDLCTVQNISLQRNMCLQEILNYICRVGDTRQKMQIINQLKNNLDNQYCLSFLCQLGYEKSILLTCDNFLRGTTVDFSPEYLEFGSFRKSRKLLLQFIKLYSYSLEKSNDRRQILLRTAQIGISKNITKKNYFLFNSRMQRLIRKRKNDNNYFEFIDDYVNEVKQIVFCTSTS